MQEKLCFHCGDMCNDTFIVHQSKSFCCHGCKTVFDILNENDLTYYYDIEKTPGTSPKRYDGAFDYLQNEVIVRKLLDFDEQGTRVVLLHIPSIHCSSCIWVLENVHKIHTGVRTSQVNFPKKTVRITFSSEELSLYDLVQLLAKIGYEPYISLEDDRKKESKIDRSLNLQTRCCWLCFWQYHVLILSRVFRSIRVLARTI